MADVQQGTQSSQLSEIHPHLRMALFGQTGGPNRIIGMGQPAQIDTDRLWFEAGQEPDN